MEADFIRLILFITGALLVLGIYFWERGKRVQTRNRSDLREKADKVEPSFRSAPLDSDTSTDDAGKDEPANIDDELEQLNRIIQSEHDPGSSGEPAEPDSERGRRPGPQGDLFGFSLRKSEKVGASARAAEKPLPKLIIQINIAARNRPFSGEEIDRVTHEVDLQPGDMKIFHRFHKGSEKRRVVFSMANMVEPGNFPVDDMASFSSPGLTLFAQLPGPLDGLATLSDMLFSAERIAALLDGELQDGTHSVLSKQTIEHMRSQILEHRRQVQLAYKKA